MAISGVLAVQPAASYRGSAPFERMKSLAGTWKGTHDMGNGPMKVTAEYRVVASGSAVEERLFAGTPMEMVTMYHDKNGRLALTHYCLLHNRPAMRLKSADANRLIFDFDPACGVNQKSTHMHALTLNFTGPNTITHDWTLFENGKPAPHHPFTLTRVRR
jgi:hypothetical protein